MPSTSSGLRYPASTDSPFGSQQIQNLATDADAKVVPAYASTSARNTAIPSPAQGRMATVAGLLHRYDGTAWRYYKTGYSSGAGSVTDSGGNLVIPHGLGVTPTGVILTSGPQGTDLLNRVLTLNYSGSDATNFVVYAHRSDTSANLPSNQIQVAWIAFV